MKKIQLYKFTTQFELLYDSKNNISSFEIEDIIDSFEQRFSRFVQKGELSVLNKNGGGEMSPDFQELLELSLHISDETKGFFNPLVNVESLGYSSQTYSNSEKIVGILRENININGNILTLRNNNKLDFGGIGKGFLIDKISKHLLSKKVENFFINFGGDIYTSGYKNSGEKWKIGLENPFQAGETFAHISLSNMSVSSSGTYKRKWKTEGNLHHHIINPLSGKNQYDIHMVTILGEKTYISDSIATAVVNMGKDQGIQFLYEKGLDGMIIDTQSKAYFTKGFTTKYNLQYN